jgi:hypothetical protein
MTAAPTNTLTRRALAIIVPSSPHGRRITIFPNCHTAARLRSHRRPIAGIDREIVLLFKLLATTQFNISLISVHFGPLMSRPAFAAMGGLMLLPYFVCAILTSGLNARAVR